MISLQLGERMHDSVCTVTVAPMVGINYQGLPEIVVYLLVLFFVFIGFGECYILGRKDRSPKTIVNGPISTDEVHVERWNAMRRRIPRIITGGIVWNWMRASMQVKAQFLCPSLPLMG